MVFVQKQSRKTVDMNNVVTIIQAMYLILDCRQSNKYYLVRLMVTLTQQN